MEAAQERLRRHSGTAQGKGWFAEVTAVLDRCNAQVAVDARYDDAVMMNNATKP